VGRQQGNALLNLSVCYSRRKRRAGTDGHPSPASGSEKGVSGLAKGRQGGNAPSTSLLSGKQ